MHPKAKLHYLPHHGVRKSSSTTALRLVFDCSSNNPSLNQCLHSGPSLITDLTKILLKIRLRRYATSSDIEKAFLAIRLRLEDRDSTRFLWLTDPSDPRSPLVTYRFTSVLFGATCSPFLLAACIQHHVRNSDTDYEDVILNQIYVDNLFGTFDTEAGVEDFFLQSRSLFEKAGLNLREWVSNCQEANVKFRENKAAAEDTTIKVLGMEWDTNEDTISYPLKVVASEAATKRAILRNLASIFDPLGILSPVAVRGKILLQKLWKEKLSWDKPISVEHRKEWVSIADHLQRCLQLTIPRQLIFARKVELHAFSDASGAAYATAVYLS